MDNNPYAASPNADKREDDGRSRIRRVKRFDPVQTGKLLAALYFGISLLMVPFLLLFAAVGPKGSGIGAGFALVIPFLYAAIGFIGGIIAAFVYNLCAKFVGGLEVEIE
jgi:hypothetical protein